MDVSGPVGHPRGDQHRASTACPAVVTGENCYINDEWASTPGCRGLCTRDPLTPNDLRAGIALFLLTYGVSYFP